MSGASTRTPTPSRSASTRTSTSARRRRAPCGWGRRRPPSRRRSSRATPTCSRASSSTSLARRPRRRPTGDERERLVPAAQDLRGRDRRPASSPSGRTRSRTRCSRRASRGDGEELPLRTAQARLAAIAGYAERDALGERRARGLGGLQRRAPRAARRARRAARPSVRGVADPVARNEEEKGISLRPLLRRRRPARVESDRRRSTPQRARWLDAPARPGARGRCPRVVPHGLDAAALAARVDLHEGAVACRSASRRSARSASTSRPSPGIRLDLDDRPQKSPRACVIAVRPAARRAPDHARAGRAARLRGVPARGRPRAPLRGLRPRRCRTPSAGSRATTR